MAQLKKTELIEELHDYEQLFHVAERTIAQHYHEARFSWIILLMHEHVQSFASFCKANKLTLHSARPAQLEELFPEIQSLLPDACHSELTGSPCFTTIKKLHLKFLEQYEKITPVNCEAFFRSLATIAYCVRSELEARKG